MFLSLGLMFISAVIHEQSVSNLLQYGKIEHLFRKHELEHFNFVREFVKQHGKIPSLPTITAHVGMSPTPAVENSSYYFDILKERFIEDKLRVALKEVQDQLKAESKNVMGALETVVSVTMDIVTKQSNQQITDFRDAYDLIIPDYVAKYNSPDKVGLHLGWPTIDEASGGLGKGEMFSLIGRPNLGKTWAMLYAMHYGWNQAGLALIGKIMAAGSDVQGEKLPEQSRAFFSMEMATLPITQRLAAMQAHIPATLLKHAGLPSTQLKTLKNGLKEIKGYGAPFWVIEGNLSKTVEDMHLICRQLQPDAIGVDGGYLVAHPTERDRYRKVAENAHLMKTELAALAPLAVSWQFARTASKKKKGEKVTGDDIAYSDAILQISTIVDGIFEEESVETIHRRRHELMKGRYGEVGTFYTNWDHVGCRFEELQEQKVEELQYL
jgi:hypothetical protein